MKVTDLQVLIPMAGLGTRFSSAGFALPKPLISVGDQPMYRLAMRSLDGFPGNIRFFSVIQLQHHRKFGLGYLLTSGHPAFDVTFINHQTRGAAETALSAFERLDPDSALLIMDCDLFFLSDDFLQAISDPGIDFDAALISFESSDPRYSYAQIDAESNVVLTAEKQPISSHALIGAYFFSRAHYFREAALQLLGKGISESTPEFYISLVMNEVICSGLRVKLFRGDFYSFGTPEELVSSMKRLGIEPTRDRTIE